MLKSNLLVLVFGTIHWSGGAKLKQFEGNVHSYEMHQKLLHSNLSKLQNEKHLGDNTRIIQYENFYVRLQDRCGRLLNDLVDSGHIVDMDIWPAQLPDINSIERNCKLLKADSARCAASHQRRRALIDGPS